MDGGIDVKAFVRDANEKITRRGFILWDHQILTTPITDVIDEGVLLPSDDKRAAIESLPPSFWVVYEYNSSRKVGTHTEVLFEHRPSDGALDLRPYTVPPKRDWSEAQQEYFGLVNPYQMVEDEGEYTHCHIISAVPEPALAPDERIAAILHGLRDAHYFNCQCHHADVVYTTKRRLVCMACGTLHVVLRDPLPVRPGCLLTADEWGDFFYAYGRRLDEELDLPIVDFCDVEEAPLVWSTHPWDEAKKEFIFFARSSPEEIEEAIRGTERDPSIFMEAGWSPLEVAPPPAHQIARDSVAVDLRTNAAYALREGVRWFLASRTSSEHLVNGIPQLFRVVELMLKDRLQALDPTALADQPNNPKVLARLRGLGVTFTNDELETINRLRRLRNALQHGTAQFNQRAGLAICRSAIVLIDRFAEAELDSWMGDVVEPDDWRELLTIPEIATTALRISTGRVAQLLQLPNAVTSVCPACSQNTMVRRHPTTGAECLYCGHVPGPTEPGAAIPDRQCD